MTLFKKVKMSGELGQLQLHNAMIDLRESRENIVFMRAPVNKLERYYSTNVESLK